MAHSVTATDRNELAEALCEANFGKSVVILEEEFDSALVSRQVYIVNRLKAIGVPAELDKRFSATVSRGRLNVQSLFDKSDPLGQRGTLYTWII